MQKNSILFVTLSAFTVFIWYFFFAQPSEQSYRQMMQLQNTAAVSESGVNKFKNADLNEFQIDDIYAKEEHINIETEQYKAVLTNKGGGVLSWSVKEKNGQWVDLVFPESAPVMANFPNLTYKVVSKSAEKIVFEYASKEGWKITKIYNLSDLYMHNLNISVEKNAKTPFPQIDLKWGPGLGTDSKELKENISLTRALVYTAVKPNKLKKLKDNFEPASLCKWTAVDNRYFLVAFIPKNSMDFDKILFSRLEKKHPCSVILKAAEPKDVDKKDYSVNFYLGPKDYKYLKTYDLGLEKTVDFGFFGFLGKIAFSILVFFYKLTHNYGWAIIMLTTIIQILVLPLTLKSFKSSAAMKRVQPVIKDIQMKYKDNPQRLKAEMLNIYQSQKVNPLGGCLPMLLQLPIFWAFFTMLRNAYELRNEGWILWVKDLSAADQFMQFGSFNLNLLPLMMGIGMFFQQRMTTVTSDPTQRKIMYIMPVIFTFMFWSFPSGLVLYWLTNSLISMIEQYFIMKKDAITVKHI
ncbi:membrane protein insertase YidC [Endomicrobiia bacterium]|uniref:membrane protein insertase YidC n=1 Tax=Endomicrobium trichonymphae TaxID=1408204 RepID=UPI0008664FEF|nr:membrane protein insertase YidC [Candidatus Endomicrobium trichonymphae]BAV58623.1 protein translocase subunit YidC [Candidatus Endomicrobium trichonymphae]GHT22501.1 membrane protein insertase YidC [Endomicrobiia bacterium]